MKRTKKQKVKANNRRVNSQLTYKFDGSYNFDNKNKDAKYTDISANLASTKNELYKSLFASFLILISLGVVYWVQN